MKEYSTVFKHGLKHVRTQLLDGLSRAVASKTGLHPQRHGRGQSFSFLAGLQGVTRSGQHQWLVSAIGLSGVNRLAQWRVVDGMGSLRQIATMRSE